MVTKVVVFGMGYVGIPIAALLADIDEFQVTGIQRRSERSSWKIDILNQGKSPFKGKEPGLDELIARVVKKKSFSVTDDPSVAKYADYILIDVQTPTDSSHIPQYESLRTVSAQIGKYLKKGSTVIIESTVAPGTTENVVKPIIEECSRMTAGDDFHLAFSYERVMPGKLLDFIVNMPRVVGGFTPKCTEKAVWLYQKVVTKDISITSCLAAELAKTIENSYRDINIAFANEMALVCESLKVNIYEIIELINKRHDRFMHYPGAGVGGHCLPKDPWLLRYGVQTYGREFIEPEFISLSRKINNHMPIHLAGLAVSALEAKGFKLLSKVKITVLGVAYLENSDDTRNTPALPLIRYLNSLGAKVIAHDPYVNPELFKDWPVENNLEKALEKSDCAIIVTKHAEYYKLNFSKLKNIMNTHILIDGRNVYDAKDVKQHGFLYNGIGKNRDFQS